MTPIRRIGWAIGAATRGPGRTPPGRRARRRTAGRCSGSSPVLSEHLELLTAGAHHLQGALEDDLEAGQLLVAEVLDLVLEAGGLVGGGVDDLAGAGLAGLHHLGALHHPLGAGAGLVEDVLALPLHLGEVLLALLEQPAGGPELVGQPLDGLVEQVEHLVPVDHHRGGQRHGPGRRHELVEAAEHVLDVGRRGCGDAVRARRAGRASSGSKWSDIRIRTSRAGAWRPRAGTMLDTSPPKRAMSRMYFDAMAELAEAEGRNRVCTPETFRLIWA